MGRLAMITVAFLYLTGFTRPVFRNARLTGSWDNWTEVPMDDVVADDGCPAFVRSVEFEDSLAGQVIRWGVRLDGPPGANVWGITTEVQVPDSQERYREFRLPGPGGVHEERYYLTWSRRLGAQKFYAADTASPDLTFAVWAPNARAVDVVFGEQNSGPTSQTTDQGSTLPCQRSPSTLDPTPRAADAITSNRVRLEFDH